MSRPMKNIPGTTGERCPCHGEAWLWHHKDVTGSRQTVCSVYRCGNEARVGGHLWFTVGGVEFIAPLCHGCNKIPHYEAFDLKDWVVLAHADRPASRAYNQKKRRAPAARVRRADRTGVAVLGIGFIAAVVAAGLLLD